MKHRFARTAVWLLTGLLMLMALFPALIKAQDAVPPDETDAQVIAQGISSLPDGPLAWRVTTVQAGNDDEAKFVERSLGFVVVSDGYVLITNDDTNQQTLLSPAQAAFHQEGAVEQHMATGGEAATYRGIELVSTNTANQSSGQVDFTGEAFDSMPGDKDLQLFSSVMQAGEVASFSGGNAPHVLVMLVGSVTTADGTTLSAGDVVQQVAQEELTAGDEGAWWLAGVIGVGPEGLNSEGDSSEGDDSMAVDPGQESDQVETGSLLLSLYDCDVVTQDGTVEDCAPSDDPWEVSLSAGQQQWTNFQDAADLGNGQYRFLDLPAGEVFINIDPDFDGPVQVTQGRDIYWAGGDGLGTWGVQIVAGQEAEGEAYRGVADDTKSANGSLVIKLYDCTDLQNVPSTCQPTDTPWEITISRQGGSGTIYPPDVIENGFTYRYTDLIPGTWFVNLDPDFDGPIQVQEGGDVYWAGGDGMGTWAVEVAAGSEADGLAYRQTAQVSVPDVEMALRPSGNGDPERGRGCWTFVCGPNAPILAPGFGALARPMVSLL